MRAASDQLVAACAALESAPIPKRFAANAEALAKQLAELPAAAAELASACSTLVAAPVPKRFAAREAELKTAFAALCQATSELQTAAAGADPAVTTAAVETVHTRYQATEKLFQ